MVDSKPTDNRYTAIDCITVADSISENGDRLTTFLVGMPPHTHDIILQLPNCNVTPCYRGWTAEMIRHSSGDISGPTELAEKITPFGKTVVDGAFVALRDTANKALDELINVDCDFPLSVYNSISLPVSMQVYMISGVDWFEARMLLDQSGDPALQALNDAIRTYLDTVDPIELPVSEWHVPFMTKAVIEEIVAYAQLSTPDTEKQVDMCMDLIMRVSAARCARGGPVDFEGNETNLEEEIARYSVLDDDWVACQSALGHLAYPDLIENKVGEASRYRTSYLHGPLRGWVSARRAAFLGKIEAVPVQEEEEPENNGATLTLINGGLNG